MRDEWKKVTLGEIADLQTGPFGSQLKFEEYVQNGIPVVMPINIDLSGTISINKIAHTSEKKASLLKKYKLKNGDIVFSRRGDLSKIGYITNDQSGWLCGTGCLRARPKENIVSCFLHLYLKQKNVANWLEDNSIGQTMKNINTNILSKLPIILPSYEEQKKIAETLSIWDLAIEKTEKLISEKEKMFDFVLKRLLSKKGTSCCLKQIVSIKKGKQLNKENMVLNGTVPVLNGGISYSGFTNFANTQKNTIAISEGGNSCGYVNYVSEDFWAGGHCYTLELKDKDVETKFLYWMLKSKEKEIMKLRVGSGLPNIQQNDLCNLTIEIYNKKDQLKIIELLDCQQREISLLKKQLEQYKLQKQGLMQKLLTGEWRIK